MRGCIVTGCLERTIGSEIFVIVDADTDEIFDEIMKKKLHGNIPSGVGCSFDEGGARSDRANRNFAVGIDSA